MRATVLAIIASLVLLGSTASVADAIPQTRAAIAADAGYPNADPGDPGLPPDN